VTRKSFGGEMPHERSQLMLDAKQKKQLEDLTVEMILTLRAAYLSVQDGRPPMNYWEQFQNRMVAASQMTVTASEWVGMMQETLGIGSLNSSQSRDLVRLDRFCAENEAHDDFLDFIQRDHALVIALSQIVVDEKKNEKKEVSGATNEI
jgi:hypothetical protein